jgi:hypothetical protein
MQNNSNKSNKRDPETAIRVKRTADLTGVSPRTVYRVIIGDPKISNETIDKVLSVYMQLKEGEKEIIENIKNQLTDAVEQLVPFN